MGQPPAPVTAAWLESRGAPLDQRLESVTRELIGVPYRLSPLGEGNGTDQDPRLRFDAFDCTTFVETAIALVRSATLGELLATLDDIRYEDATPSFERRRHLIASQWLPGLAADGYITDVTAAVGCTATRIATIEVGPEIWRRRRVARGHDLEPRDAPQGRFALAYVPIAALVETEVPAATILSVVRAERVGSPILVTHQGLVLRDPRGELVIRHASPRPGRVVDEPLAEFLARQAKHRRWPVVGVHLARVVPPVE